ncbi:MAG TPA: hypothetical protein DCM41_00375 [Synergistaceae bacterium]|nr:hypothetical protein [Synergistaceae bacterium]
MAEKIREYGIKSSAENASEIRAAMAELDRSTKEPCTCPDTPVHPIRFVKDRERKEKEHPLLLLIPLQILSIDPCYHALIP